MSRTAGNEIRAGLLSGRKSVLLHLSRRQRLDLVEVGVPLHPFGLAGQPSGLLGGIHLLPTLGDGGVDAIMVGEIDLGDSLGLAIGDLVRERFLALDPRSLSGGFGIIHQLTKLSVVASRAPFLLVRASVKPVRAQHPSRQRNIVADARATIGPYEIDGVVDDAFDAHALGVAGSMANQIDGLDPGLLQRPQFFLGRTTVLVGVDPQQDLGEIAVGLVEQAVAIGVPGPQALQIGLGAKLVLGE